MAGRGIVTETNLIGELVIGELAVGEYYIGEYTLHQKYTRLERLAREKCSGIL
jgi:hypothetical protein